MTDNAGERRYWVIHKETFPGDLDVSDFLKEAGYNVESNGAIFSEDGYIAQILKPGQIEISLSNIDPSNLRHINSALDLAELLDVNDYPYYENKDRDSLSAVVGMVYQDTVAKIRDVPVGKA